ncbi:MAG: DUF1800 family protein [Verrucomicrobiota bacterium]|nr:DUF1800 family protein [Verrucomicrobiota bacterium]
MSSLKQLFGISVFAVALAVHSGSQAQPLPDIGITRTNGNASIRLPLYPAAEQFRVFKSQNLEGPYEEVLTGNITGFNWQEIISGQSNAFFKVEINTLSSNDLLSATVLNRLAYGPTPDELERVRAMGAEAYIAEQLAPENIQETLDFDQPVTAAEWRYVTITGTATSRDFYIYLTQPGDVYLDDMKLVAGIVPEVGANLLVNGDFESALTPPWTVSANHAATVITSAQVHSGSGALHLIADDGGTSKSSSVWQTISNVTVGQTYTLSYWFRPGTNLITSLTIRFSNDGLRHNPDSIATKLASGLADLDDLRAWHVLRAIKSKRQLLEILLQFLENHFVTQASKSKEYFDGIYSDDILIEGLATEMEYRENKNWRAALLRPDCSFHDLLKISAESPAMIIYLDTVGSKGNGKNVANENYARELLELFTFGVDNGYQQNDITVLSRAWTGWSVNIVDSNQFHNPFAPRSVTVIPGSPTNTMQYLQGIWAFNYKTGNHNTNSKTIFPGATVPARFGPPYAGRNYQLVLPQRNGTNGIKDGYEVLAHLADQPFTQEYISVKLCQLFVHEHFEHGYDFTDPNLSEEGKLVRACMATWESTTPKGQIRPILQTIFNSEMFRGLGSASHKVKTPLEFTVSAVRALWSPTPFPTAYSDGYSHKNPLDLMGAMKLFDRAEPDGYPESAPGWISAGTLAERVRFVQAMLIAPGQSGRGDAGQITADPVALLKRKLDPADYNNAGKIADYFLSILFPGEGKANLKLYHEACVSFLNTGDNGIVSSPISLLAHTSIPYDTRVRGMVAMLMSSQRFQEQ